MATPNAAWLYEPSLTDHARFEERREALVRLYTLQNLRAAGIEHTPIFWMPAKASRPPVNIGARA